MNRKWLNLFFLGAALILGGCQTPNFKPIINPPSDKALVYLYRKNNYFGSGVGHKIFANQKPVTLLFVRNYYAYLTDPGEIKWTSKQVEVGEEHILDFMIPKYNLGQTTVEAGKTYYLKVTWTAAYWPEIVQVDNETGAREITNCLMAESFETNVVAK